MSSEANVIVKNGKVLRLGYTTGSCATAVATAATQMLLTQKPVYSVLIVLPSGEKVTFLIEDCLIGENKASCSVRKDAGDDPDVTDGIQILAECTFSDNAINSANVPFIKLEGGKGIGVVTVKGLACAVGEAAINPTPRKMIMHNVAIVCEKFGCDKGRSSDLCIITIFRLPNFHQ